MAAAAAVFFLRQTPVESQEAEAAQELEYLRVAELPQAGRASLPPLAVAEAANPPEQLRGAEKQQPLPGGSLKQHQAPSRNTSAAVAGKSAVLVFPFVLVVVPYQNQCAPGTPLSDSLLISKEIL